MRKKRIIIVGAGISGLSCAWYLSKLSHLCDFIILEKSKRAGGFLHTETSGGFLFEKGPRTFAFSRCQELLDIVEGLGLQDQLIFSSNKAKSRYLWIDHKLKKIPFPLLSFSFFKEWFVEPKADQEETIYEFAVRRFNEKIAQRLFDPLALGVFAGDIRTLSLNSCFPYFKRLEKNYGSVTKGLLKENFTQKKTKNCLFSFQGGVQTFIDALHHQLKHHLHLGEEVASLHFSRNKVEVQTSSGVLEADYVISALPLSSLGRIFQTIDKEITTILDSIKLKGLTCINFGFKNQILPYNGFGYLVPSSEQQQLYGAVFDSSVFPEQNQDKEETRITVMMKETPQLDPVPIALSELKRHLNMTASPDFVKTVVYKQALPQYEIGHQKRVQSLKDQLLNKYPACRLLGNFLTGPSVNECIVNSSELVVNLERELGRTPPLERSRFSSGNASLLRAPL